jgi:K+-transporting ATPase KdpF subunit
MNVLHTIAALIALALAGYLAVALLKPVWFE